MIRKLMLVAPLVWNASNIQAEKWLVVANKRFIADTVNKEQLRRIYQGKQHYLYDYPVQAIQQAPQSEAFHAFTKFVLNQTPSQAIQAQMLHFLSGKHLAPRTLRSEQELVEWLRNHPDSIGYIERSSMVEALKPIYTIR